MPPEIKNGSSAKTVNVYASQAQLREIYSMTQKSFHSSEVFPIFAPYFVQVNFANSEFREKFEKFIRELAV